MSAGAMTKAKVAPALGWAGWDLEAGRLHGRSIHAEKRDLLVGYDFMALAGLDTCEDRMLWNGVAIVPVEVAPGPRRTGCLYATTWRGEIYPRGLGWSSLSESREGCLGCSARLVAAYPEDFGLDAGSQPVAILHTFPYGPEDRDTKKERNARGLAIAMLEEIGVGAIPVRIRRIEGGRAVPPVELPEGYRLIRRYKVGLAELVDPSRYADHFRDLETYVDLCRSARKAPHGEAGPIELLSGGSHINGSSVDEIGGKDWHRELDRRFRHLLLRRHNSPAAEAWKAERGVALDRTIVVNWPTTESTPDRPYWVGGKENPLPGKMVDELFGPQPNLAWSLNTCWPKAIAIHGVRMHFSRIGAGISIEYGFRSEDGSPSGSWYRPLAYQRPGEPLLCTIVRARAELARLQDPRADPPVIDSRQGKIAKPARDAPGENHDDAV